MVSDWAYFTDDAIDYPECGATGENVGQSSVTCAELLVLKSRAICPRQEQVRYRIDNVRRGFCSICGSSLFFDPDGTDWIGLAMDAFDTPTKTKLRMHVFAGVKAIITILRTVCRNISPIKSLSDNIKSRGCV